MRMTDACENVALVLLIISENNAVGRISIPVSYTKGELTVKELGDEFSLKFNAKCIHDGTRLEAFVSDFQLQKSLVNDESLKDVFGRVESLFSNIL